MSRPKGTTNIPRLKGFVNSNYEEISRMGYKKATDGLYAKEDGSILVVKEYNDLIWIREAKVSITKAGYAQVGLSKGTGAVGVHTLVMLAYVGPRPEGYEVDHIDKDKLNNNLSNLRYLTIRENRAGAAKPEHRKYLGRYCSSTRTYLDAEGNRTKMSIPEYYFLLGKLGDRSRRRRFFNKHREEITNYFCHIGD